MAATLSEQASRPETAEPNEASPVSATPVMARDGLLSATPAAAGVTASLAVVFCYFVFLPLWHTDLWGHLSYGRYLQQTAALPETEPLMPLSEGMSFVDTVWLCQLLGYETIRLFGVAGIQNLHAIGVTLCLALVALRVWSRTQSGPFALLSAALFLWVGWQHLAVVRPQLAGLVCFSILFSMLSARRWSKINWAAVPLLFAVWANLHGSFLVGLAVLGAFCVGRGCDVLRRTDKFSAVVSDRSFRRYLLLGELAAAAVLLNPYGIGLYAEVWSISANANLSDIVEWEPLTLRMKQGQAAAMVALALVMVFRVSPRRVGVAEILLLVGLGGAALWMSRMIIWWAPVAGYFVALHGHAAWQAARKQQSNANPAVRRPLWLAVSAVAVVLAVAAKPLEPVFRGRRANVARARLSAETPVAAVRHLRDNPPIGQIFNSYEWGDYLIWAGPPDAEVFVASHAHLVPREVWQIYMRVINLSTGWEDALARFGVNTVLIEKQRRRRLVARLRDHEDWQISFEDNRAIVFRRTVPIGALAY